MTATATFRFGEYELRPAGTKRGDLGLAVAWVDSDPDHQGTPPGFWIDQKANIDSYLLSDDSGPVFFFKIVQREQRENAPFFTVTKIAEIHIQFRPVTTRAERERLMTALQEGLVWLEKVLASVGVQEIYFDSRNTNLIRFCLKRLAFTQDGERLTKRIGSSTETLS